MKLKANNITTDDRTIWFNDNSYFHFSYSLYYHKPGHFDLCVNELKHYVLRSLEPFFVYKLVS